MDTGRLISKIFTKINPFLLKHTHLYHHISESALHPVPPFIQIGPHKSVSLAPLPRKEASFGQMRTLHVVRGGTSNQFKPSTPTLSSPWQGRHGRPLVEGRKIFSPDCKCRPSYPSSPIYPGEGTALTTLVYVYGFGFDDRVRTCNIAHVRTSKNQYV